MSRKSDAAGPNPSRKGDRLEAKARRKPPARSFRPGGTGGHARAAEMERLEDRTLLAIGFNMNPIGSASDLSNAQSLAVPITTATSANGGDTVFVLVAFDDPNATAPPVSILDFDSQNGAKGNFLAGKAADIASGDESTPASNTFLYLYSQYITNPLVAGDKILLGFPSGVTAKAASVYDAIGVAATSALDARAASPGTVATTSAVATLGIASPTVAANELAIGGIAVGQMVTLAGQLNAATAPFYLANSGAENATTGISLLPQDQVVTTAGQYTPAATVSVAGSAYAAVIASYKPQYPSLPNGNADLTINKSTTEFQPLTNLPLIVPGATIAGAGAAAIKIIGGPSHGTVTPGVIDPVTHTQTYTYTETTSPTPVNGVETDQFQYEITDGTLGSADLDPTKGVVTVTITFNPIAPTITPATQTIKQDVASSTIKIMPDSREANFVTNVQITNFDDTGGTGSKIGSLYLASSYPGANPVEVINNQTISAADAEAGLVFVPMATANLPAATNISFTAVALAANLTLASLPSQATTITVDAVADLNIKFDPVTSSGNSAIPFPLTLELTNNGPSSSTNLVLTDIPVNSTLASIQINGGTVYTNLPAAGVGGAVVLDLANYGLASLAPRPGVMVPIVLTVVPGGGTATVNTISNTATISEDQVQKTNSTSNLTATTSAPVSTSYTVTTSTGTGPGSLPYIVDKINGLTVAAGSPPAFINFKPNNFGTGNAITLASTITISNPVILDGAGQTVVITGPSALLFLDAKSDGSTVENLTLQAGSAVAAIEVNGGVNGDQILNDTITGSASIVTNSVGVEIDGGATKTIIRGGQISGFDSGIFLNSSTFTTIQSVTIGTTDPSGVGNNTGIKVTNSTGNNIGGFKLVNGNSDADISIQNTIAYNKTYGIDVTDTSSPNDIWINSIYQNGGQGGLGHGLVRQTVSPDPKSLPAILGAVFYTDTTNNLLTLRLFGTVPTNMNYRVDVYAQDVDNPRTMGGTGAPNDPSVLTPPPQGRLFLASFLTDTSGKFDEKLDAGNYPQISEVELNQFVTITATNTAADTTPISTPVIVSSPLAVVNTYDVDMPGSLRFALNQAASLKTGTAVILFEIPDSFLDDPNSKTFTIKLKAGLPEIKTPVSIEGYSQKNSDMIGSIDPKTKSPRTSALLSVRIDGSLVTSGAGLTISDTASISGIDFLNFDRPMVPAILVDGGADSTIVGNDFGFDSNGVPANSFDAIQVTSVTSSKTAPIVSSLSIGGPDVSDRNTFIGFAHAGVEVKDPSTSKLLIQDNTFASGGTTTAPAVGVIVDSSPGVTILGNTIIGAYALGVKLTGDFQGSAEAVVVSKNLIGTDGIASTDRSKETINEGILISGVSNNAAAPTQIIDNQIVGASGLANLDIDQATNVQIFNNFIGVDSAQLAGTTQTPYTNGGDGVLIRGNSSLISVISNIIAGNSKNGVEINGAFSANMQPVEAGVFGSVSIQSNGIGADLQGAALVGNGESAVLVVAATTAMPSMTATPPVTLASNGIRGNKASLANIVEVDTSTDVALTGGTIDGDGGPGVGVRIANGSGNSITGTHITDLAFVHPTGTTKPATGGIGVVLSGTDSAILGGVLIDSVNNDGILVSGGSGNSITNATISDVVGVLTTTTGHGSTLSVFQGGVGISLLDAMNTAVKDGSISGALNQGIFIDTGSGNSISGMTISGIMGSSMLSTDAKGHQTILTQVGGEGILAADSPSLTIGAQQTSLSTTNAGLPISKTNPNIIENNGWYGIDVMGSSSTGVIVASNDIGTDANGTADNGTLKIGNHDAGILIDHAPGVRIYSNVVGDTVQDSGTGDGFGIEVSNADGADIEGNTVGTDRTGTVRLSNASTGIELVAATDAVLKGNNISDNKGDGLVADSLSLMSESATPKGLLVSGNSIEGNQANGVTIDGLNDQSTETVDLSGNTISGNSRWGVMVSHTKGLTLESNMIGTDSAGQAALGNKLGGVALDDTPSANIDQKNVISGNGGVGPGNDGVGLKISSTNTITVANNYVGLGLDGTSTIGNTAGGVLVIDSTNVTIQSNTISSNGPDSDTGFGLLVVSDQAGPARTVTIEDNRIGTDSVGVFGRGNRGRGVSVVRDQTAANITATISGNFLSNNVGDGLFLSGVDGASVSGNHIGEAFSPGMTGLVALGNGGDGLWLLDTTNATVSGNTVVGNLGLAGVDIQGNSSAPMMDDSNGPNILLMGNSIGTIQGAPSAGFGNLGEGIAINAASKVTVLNDVIASNGKDGVADLGGDGLKVVGSFIGTSPLFNTEVHLGNAGNGVAITGAKNVSITGNWVDDNLITGLFANGDISGLAIQSNVFGAGTNSSGKVVSLGNHQDDILIKGTSTTKTKVGITVIGNIVAAAGGNGLEIRGTHDEVNVSANLIGSASGSASNSGDGLFISAMPSAVSPLSVFVSDNQIIANGKNGVELVAAKGVQINGGNTITNNLADGILIQNQSNSNVIENNLLGTSNTIILANEVNGVELLDSSANSSSSLVIDKNLGNGLHLGSGSALNGFVGLSSEDNVGNGVFIDGGSSNNSFYDSFVLGNSVNGFDIRGGSMSNLVHTVEIEDNRNSGVLILDRTSMNNTLFGDPISGNLNDGVSLIDAGGRNAIASDTIIENHNNGVLISGTQNSLIGGSYIGTDEYNVLKPFDPTGTSLDPSGVPEGNQNFGLFLNGATNTFVGYTLDPSTNNAVLSPNAIWDNASHGVVISNAGSQSASSNFVVGNSIDRNNLTGVLLVNTSGNQIGLPGIGNVIDANETDGVAIFDGSANSVQGNNIGTDSTSLVPLGNKGDGVHLVDTPSNTIGGPDAADRNVISANNQSGVELFGNLTTTNAILGDIIGTIQGNPELGNKVDGVLIAGSSAQGGTSNPRDNFIGEVIQGQARANIIAGNLANGVAIETADDNYVLGNLIGPTKGGALLGNGLDGVSIQDATGTTVGSGNFISSNGGEGIYLNGTTASSLSNNTIIANIGDGIDLLGATNSAISGTTIQSNGADGIRVEESSTTNLIGLPGAGNTITGQTGAAGIEIRTGSTGNKIQGNQIGFISSGYILPNSFGVLLNQVSDNTVGGTALNGSMGANTITGDLVAGVEISGNGNGDGNLVRFNFLGTDPSGNSPDVFPSLTPALSKTDVGVLALNSSKNILYGNLASGNDLAGIELFGVGSSFNMVLGNIIGSTLDQSAPILLHPELGRSAYSALDLSAGPAYVATRQQYGIWIDGAMNNMIGSDGAANQIMGNQDGIEIDGSTAINNLIASNFIGPASYVPGSPNVDGLGNFIGVYANNTSDNTIEQNVIARNVSVGVALVGPAAGSNVVANNAAISSNGGYAVRTTDPNQSVYDLVSQPDAQNLANAGTTVYLFGDGIYVQSGQLNTIAYNTIADNTQIGIYVFGTGTLTANSIFSNTIAAHQYSAALYNGDYGVLLYNSSGNLPNGNLPGNPPTGVILVGPGANNFASPSRIADFREFTGAVNPVPSTVAPAAAVSTSKSIKAASIGGVAVTVKAGGKGHPLPPTSKSFARKR